jgi:hypothetical protein
VPIADFDGAQEHGVTLSSGDAAGRGVHALAEIGDLIESGRFSRPVAQTFPLRQNGKRCRDGASVLLRLGYLDDPCLRLRDHREGGSRPDASHRSEQGLGL